MFVVNRTNSTVFGLVALTLCHVLPLCAAESQALFNGRNLEGWSGDDKLWSVRDGQIVGSTVDNPIEANTFLVWQGGDVGDFRLNYIARLEGDNNSGVQYRSTLTDPKIWKVVGYQADMHANPEYLAMLYSEGTGRGIVATRGQKVIVDADSGKPEIVSPTTATTPVDVSKWHEYEIVARGNHLVHRLDGKVTVDVIDNHREKRDRGIIALQLHAGPPMTVYFKGINLETFPADDEDDDASSEGTQYKAKTSSRNRKVPSPEHREIGAISTPPEIETVAAGFRVEKVFNVPESMGSWVSLAKDDQGRLIASDQEAMGLYLITPGKPGTSEPTQVQKLPVKLSAAQGMVWAFDALYAMVNNAAGSGLHRLTDTDDDGLVDADEYLMNVAGFGEHGPHALVLAPDCKSLVVACGNHTDLMQEIVGSRVPQNWGEDQLLPRQWDPQGHAKGRLAPGGWIAQVDPNGKEWEITSIGYRNQYDMAFNADGELFAYDSDMEWDMGMPWYRSTRLVHATSGSEFGWRSGTGVWPTYYEDSLPAAVELGPGSPTGVVFGYGALFPGRYQRALFLLDWTFGTIYAVHLTPYGASYRGQVEEFITGRPLPVTDAVVGSDGALYFAVGGRGMQSALYRVTYAGTEPTTIVTAHDSGGSELRALRHKLEALHGVEGGDLDLVFTNLGHSDRFIRYAARIALESQPIESWRQRALSQSNTRAAISALIAVARQGATTEKVTVLAALDRVDLSKLDEPEKLALLRTYGLVFIRLGEPDDEARQRLIAKWDPLYPSEIESIHFNMELAQLLVYLRAPTVIEKTLALMDSLGQEPAPDWSTLAMRNDEYGGTIQNMINDMPPLRAIHFALVLRNVKSGWTLEQRRKYFHFFPAAAKHPGGMSYTGFLENIRDEALANCSAADRILLDPIVNESLTAEPYNATPPVGPGRRWTKSEALNVLGGNLENRDAEHGRNLFHAVSCAKCHRFRGEGGAIGPDLSTVANKFSLADLIDSILQPSKVISDQYGSQQVQTVDGLLVTGRVVEIGDELHVFTDDPDASPKVLSRSDVEEVVPSNVSQMPAGLIDTLNEGELKDLMAYVMSVGK